MKTPELLTPDQVAGIDRLYEHDETFLVAAMGCVDASTEYLTPSGWLPISEYDGGAVGSYDPSTKAVTFVEPDEYIKLPCDEFLHIKNCRGINQMLSSEHRMLLHCKGSDRQEVVTAKDYYDRQLGLVPLAKGQIGRGSIRLPTGFSFSGEGVSLSDADIRLMVAVKADGYLDPRRRRGTVHIRIKKQRKKDRLRELLQASDTPFTEYSRDFETAKGFTLFTFIAPEVDKHYGEDWWRVNAKQAAIIAEECTQWDGSELDGRRAFFSGSRGCADFIQFVCIAAGLSATRTHTFREREGRKSADEYVVHISDRSTDLCPYGVSATKERLHNMAWVPSPDGFKYCFSVPSTFLVLRREGCVFVTGNSGKSVVSMTALAELLRDGVLERVLVVAPLKVCQHVWGTEYKEWSHLEGLDIGICVGTEKKRVGVLQAGHAITVINFENIEWLVRRTKFIKAFDGLLIDELSKLKSGKGNTFKALRLAVKGFKWRCGMTGTPVSEDFEGLFGQTMMVDGGVRLGKNRKKFLGEYFYPEDYEQRKWCIKPDKEAALVAKVADIIHVLPDYRHKLPPVEVTECCIDLPLEAMETYKELGKTMLTTIDGVEIEAINSGVLQGKLQQIANGFIYHDVGVLQDNGEWADESYVFDLHRAKIDRVAALVRLHSAACTAPLPSRSGGVVIVYWFEWELLELQALYPNAGLLGAGVSSRDAARTIEAWNSGAMPVLLLHPRSAGHGLNIAAGGSYMIWFAPCWSNDLWLQTIARLWRRGQNDLVRVVRLIASGTVDELIRDRCNGRGDWDKKFNAHLKAL